MSIIKQQDFVESIADALQYIACYHPQDYITALAEAWRVERSPAARDAIAQILINSRMCAEGQRPICQDTGMVVVFVRVGMGVRWEGSLSLQQMVDAGVRQAYLDPLNPLRASMVLDPAGHRRNSGDNTPAVVHCELVAGDRVEVKLAAKGGGSENKARFAVLDPGASISDWVVETVAELGAGWCPPGMLGVGIGGSAERAMQLAKEALLEPLDLPLLRQRGAATPLEALRLELVERINALGIGAQGVGGVTTVLDVKIRDYPTHAASLPVALIPNCAATRHLEFTLDGSGPLQLTPPAAEGWPVVTQELEGEVRRIDLDRVTRAELESLRAGERLLLSGHLLTGRDAAHRRLAERLAAGEGLPEGVDLRGRLLYYVGPVDPVGSEVVGPAGPTTATRMDRYSEMVLGELGLWGMIGKAERGAESIAAITHHKAVYLTAVGGAAYLVAKAIRASRVVAFADLGMEAMREFRVEEMPVTVAVDSLGESLHASGPRYWREEIAGTLAHSCGQS